MATVMEARGRAKRRERGKEGGRMERWKDARTDEERRRRRKTEHLA
jgi:hypothetical protein